MTPDRKSQELQACIENMSHEGRGIAHTAGKTIFVEGALTGERVNFVYTRRRGRHDEAVVTQVLEPSEDRVVPECEHYGVCGGCSLQHMHGDAQIRLKQQALLELLTQQAKVIVESIMPPVRGSAWGYRHKARLSVRYVEKKGRVVLGFMEKRGRLVADLRLCKVLHPAVGARLEVLRDFINVLSVRHQIPQVEIAVGDHATAFILRHLSPFTESDLLQIRKFAESQHVVLYGQAGGAETVTPLWPRSPVSLTYALPQSGLNFEFMPADFTQINRAVNAALVSKAVALLEPGPADEVLDLFCGLGNFSLALARHAHTVVGLEGDQELISRARANARRNGIENAAFFAVDLALQHPTLAEPYTKVLLDPPRTGADEVLRRLSWQSVERVAYVSCNPSTLARDARYLVEEQGFRLASAGVLDMFPQTAHVESLALFVR